MNQETRPCKLYAGWELRSVALTALPWITRNEYSELEQAFVAGILAKRHCQNLSWRWSGRLGQSSFNLQNSIKIVFRVLLICINGPCPCSPFSFCVSSCILKKHVGNHLVTCKLSYIFIPRGACSIYGHVVLPWALAGFNKARQLKSLSRGASKATTFHSCAVFAIVFHNKRGNVLTLVSIIKIH